MGLPEKVLAGFAFLFCAAAMSAHADPQYPAEPKTKIEYRLPAEHKNAEPRIITDILNGITGKTEIDLGALTIQPYITLGWYYQAGINLKFGSKQFGIDAESHVKNTIVSLPEQYTIGTEIYANPSDTFKNSLNYSETINFDGGNTIESSLEFSSSIKF